MTENTRHRKRKSRRIPKGTQRLKAKPKSRKRKTEPWLTLCVFYYRILIVSRLQTVVQRIPITAGTSEADQLATLEKLHGLVRAEGRVIGSVQRADIKNGFYVLELRIDPTTPAGAQLVEWAQGKNRHYSLAD